MKIVVYLPALNEARTVGQVLDSIPTSLPGIGEVLRIVVDDGSTDGTAAVAEAHGASVVRHRWNLGTGRTFVSGVNAALRADADIVVSMDADGQFDGAHLQTLVKTLLDEEADVALCTRFSTQHMIGSMTWPKRFGNWLLTRIVSAIAGQKLTDVSCGFRAFTRDAALRVNIHSNFEYIHESLLNWSRFGLRIVETSLPVLAERPHGKSRIVSNLMKYIWYSGPVLVRAIRDYSPMKFFGGAAAAVFLVAAAVGLGVFVHWMRTGETNPYSSLITVSVGGVLLSFLLGVLALVADLIARLRYQVEEILYESRRHRADAASRHRAQG